jgi:hypothetical protein
MGMSSLKRMFRPAQRAVKVPSGTLPLPLKSLQGLSSDEAVPLILAHQGGLQQLVHEQFKHQTGIKHSPVWEAVLCMGCLTIK